VGSSSTYSAAIYLALASLIAVAVAGAPRERANAAPSVFFIGLPSFVMIVVV